ncbi:LysE family translocator [Hahella sp. KA22]|uniref:LysE family translocator n=1 Tax=Hahella sp. KA22 TaxID=1628392 RepID=UPI000FDE491C|nr:LysE family translocator [Hahella sp. KA22]AZZ91915.1 LysE family translocator [Hahella sp. KA22]QAY55286.1 LysE family translocator [Hahella sp. KA22]
MVSLEYLMTSLIVVLLPGTGVLYTVSAGLMGGRRAALFAAVGCTAGIIPHLLACALGLAAILHASSLAFQVVKYVGVAYLMYLAWMMWRDSGVVAFDASPDEKKATSFAIKACLINILNPKLSIFFLAFLPQFVPHEAASPISHMLLLSAIFMGMTLVVFTLYGLFANAVRDYIAGSPKLMQWTQKTFAGAFVALGVKLATVER